MTYLLGVDLGTTFTAAAICRRAAGVWGPAEVVPLGSRSAAVSSVLFVDPTGTVLVGEAAERRAVTAPTQVVREFKRRIGDDTPLLVGGVPRTAQDLAARLVRWVVDTVSQREGGAPDWLAVTHPAGWGEHKKSLFADALYQAGLSDVLLLSEPHAAAIAYAHTERVGVGSTIAVYDLGGGTFDASVLRKTEIGTFELLGEPTGDERLGGIDFDELIFEHLRAGHPEMFGDLDPADPHELSAVARLRRECTEAKEGLSADTDVVIQILLPQHHTQARLVRSEFEAMIRPALEDSIALLHAAIRSAGLTEAELDAVLLVGGSSRIPLVTELLSARLRRPIAVDADPKAAVAIGATLALIPIEPVPAATPAETANAGLDTVRQRPVRPVADYLPMPMIGGSTRRYRWLRPKVVAAAAGLSVLALGIGVVVQSPEHLDGLTTPAQAATPGADGNGPAARAARGHGAHGSAQGSFSNAANNQPNGGTSGSPSAAGTSPSSVSTTPGQSSADLMAAGTTTTTAPNRPANHSGSSTPTTTSSSPTLQSGPATTTTATPTTATSG